jgi:hypothetical protein
MSKLFAFITCMLTIVGGIFLYIPLDNLLSRPDWLSLSFGPTIHALLPVLMALFIVLICLALIWITISEDN